MIASLSWILSWYSESFVISLLLKDNVSLNFIETVRRNSNKQTKQCSLILFFSFVFYLSFLERERLVVKKMHAERMIYIVKTFVKRSARCSPPLFVLLWRKRFIILPRIRLRGFFWL